MRFQVVFGVSKCLERLEATWNHLDLALGRKFFVVEIIFDKFLFM